MTTAAIIVAAGSGERAGGGLAKQWRMLNGRSVLARTLDVFQAASQIDRIVLVLRAGDMAMAGKQLDMAGMVVVAGGSTRAASVLAGLRALQSDAPDMAPDKVLIHDAARPLVSGDLVARVIAGLDDARAVVPAIEVSDALWRVEDGRVGDAVARAGLVRAQTPQGFDFATILRAHEDHTGSAADDVAVARACGIAVKVVTGDARNLKITTSEDFARAEKLLKATGDIRVGNGYDVHRFGDGNAVTLCGVSIPFERGLQGHSDADVGMHALTDAIYGAVGAGDIGRFFPPSDPQWKDADSRAFLQHAMARAAERGYALGNADVTLICEAPKIAPHADAMIAQLAEITGVSADRFSVKATTTERLGFTGRGEGIAAMATATMIAT